LTEKCPILESVGGSTVEGKKGRRRVQEGGRRKEMMGGREGGRRKGAERGGVEKARDGIMMCWAFLVLGKRMMCGCWRGNPWRPIQTGCEMWRGVLVSDYPSAG
jgi:hypothetical protein